MSKEITLDDLATLIKGEFNQVGDRFDTLETRFDKLETKVGTLETKVDHLEVRFDTLEEKVDELDQKMHLVDTRTVNQADALYSRSSEVEERIGKIEKHLRLKPLSSTQA